MPNQQKTSDSQPDFRVLTQGIEIGAGGQRKGETSGKKYVNLSIAVPEFGPKISTPIWAALPGPTKKTYTR